MQRPYPYLVYRFWDLRSALGARIDEVDHDDRFRARFLLSIEDCSSGNVPV